MDENLTAIGEKSVQMWDGSQAALRRLWEKQPLVLVFLRHYG